ncbi:fibronectin type III domain-containing protein [bacterium]|nr:MAG: fibronectin type III domain-containing protein [bacterium]
MPTKKKSTKMKVKPKSTSKVAKSRSAQGVLSSNKFNVVIAGIALLLIAVVGIFVYFASRAGTSTYQYNATTGVHTGRLFSDDSPLNQTIPGDVRYAADGQTRIQTAGVPAAFSLLTWSIPIFQADATTPKANIWCYQTDIQAPWDTCHGINTSPQPVPQGMFAQKGGDGHVTVIDTSTRKIYSYWIWKDCTLQFSLNNAKWCPATGNMASIDGNGVGGGTNVAGLAGGIIRTHEIERGNIDHALTFSTSTTCKRDPIYPALYSDGTNANQATCMPIGARFQLDPSINVDTLPNITPMEKTIAKALQKYGAYVDDTGGIFGFVIELDRTGRKVYQKAGAPDHDYFPMKAIPWDKFKMLEPQWNKDGSKAYAWTGPQITTPSPTPPTTTVTPSPTPTPGNKAPVGPASLSASVISSTQINLTWPVATDDSTGTLNYTVTRNDKQIYSGPKLSFSDTGLTPATKYNYKVTAKDVGGLVSTGATTSATTQASPTTPPPPTTDTTKPSVPGNVKSKIEFDGLKFAYYTNLTWTASYDNVGVTSYEVRRNNTSLGTTTTTNFKDYNLQPNILYSYDIYAKDAATNSSLPANTKLTGRCFIIWCWGE